MTKKEITYLVIVLYGLLQPCPVYARCGGVDYS